jgi:hypothetical protein
MCAVDPKVGMRKKLIIVCHNINVQDEEGVSVNIK